MRNALISIRGTAGPESDIVAVKIYLAGKLNTTIPAVPSTEFNSVLNTRLSGRILLEHSFVDNKERESERYQQQISVSKRH